MAMIRQRRRRSEDEVSAEAPQDKENTGQDNNPPKRRSARLTRNTRSMAEGDIAIPEEIEIKRKLPFIKYKGEIKYYTEGHEIAETADLVFQWVEKQVHVDLVPMAFDMEWPFSFQTGPGKSAVIQICVEEHCCYIFQLTNLKRLPAALVALLKHPKVRLHGVNIKSDFRKLARDFPEVNADHLIEKCIDLGVWCNEVCQTGGRWSLERLANYIVEHAVDKNKKVRMSKWHAIPLDENQLLYAAIDVYIGQVIYRELEKREQIKLKNEQEFKEKNGEAAFKAIKSLGETFLNEADEIEKSETLKDAKTID
ncbi:Werner Syndrome-like exonuclease [Rhagoletis pomonella]|uniref:Werner Syndrome-like exonuclease n=1 Tax=Rhagoletis pomonella TaxID=28610 RepID=UPI00177DDF74|nr:Werner Syndrome-like exonuclease [Rhagoletis pomonella]XP_036344907.1 Werner Syndrome-like exonuclease [Rhagoletis pomonella]